MKRSAQRRLQDLIGLPEDHVQGVAEGLFATTEQHPAVYWIYLAISAGIAFFGLVMNSTAVVIGAMLVSPLMTPLVQTGMAFAVGDLYLALRSLIRVFMSMAGVVFFAALTTMILPFEQITPEIAARTQPNILDLLVALFCAVVASLTTARQAGDTVSAAAGTAISIALVPPLCVMGFGLGIMDGRVFLGSTLLFIANLSAIILVADLFFLLVGFAHVEVNLLEEKVLGEKQRSSGTYRFVKSLRLADRKNPRWARLKVALPLVFVLIVAVPLSSALSQVAWEVNTKKNINRVLSEFEKKYRILSSQQTLVGRKVALRLTIVGDPGLKEKVVEDLKVTFRLVMGQEPNLVVDFIPSEEYVSKTLKTGSDFLGKLMETMRREPTLMAQQGPSTETLPQYEQELRRSLDKSVQWLNAQTPTPQYYDWDYRIAPRGGMLTLFRIADDPLNADELGLISAVIRRDTGLDIAVSEQRLKREISGFRYPVAEARLRRDMNTAMAQISDRPGIAVTVRLKDPERFRDTRARAITARMNETLLAYLRGRIPENRLLVGEPGDAWDVALVPIRQKTYPHNAGGQVRAPSP
ncbi:MAG: DUF389 domain-containing protein [Syntrophaceae bacterium]